MNTDMERLTQRPSSSPKPQHVPFYGRQLLSDALSEERPAERKIRLSPITKLRLLCIDAIGMIGISNGVAFKDTHFLAIERDDQELVVFLSQVLTYLLEHPEPPPAAGTCSFYRYLTVGSLRMITHAYGT